MEFKFAIATDITEYAKKHFGYMYDQYEKVFITPDTNDYHLLRVLKGYGDDYEENDEAYILEVNLIPKAKREDLTMSRLRKVLEEDDGSNYDYRVFYSMGDVIERIDGGFGILNFNDEEYSN